MAIPVAKKSLGQHWLEDPTSLQAMVDAARVQSNDHVLEIGPGYGTLSKYILQTGASLTALEFDANLVVGLLAEFASNPKVSIEQGDIRSYDFTCLTPDYKIVANIPYYLTSNLVQLISETPNRPTHAVLLMQKEVAERAAAKSGDMSLLSVSAQYYWDVSLDMVVGAELFSPQPKVDSQILVLRRRDTPLFPGIVDKQFFRVVRAGFSQKRKTLHNSLSGGLAIDRDVARTLLETAGVDPTRRAQTLSLEEWYSLVKAHQAII